MDREKERDGGGGGFNVTVTGERAMLTAVNYEREGSTCLLCCHISLCIPILTHPTPSLCELADVYDVFRPPDTITDKLRLHQHTL